MEPSRSISSLITRFRKIHFDDFFILGAYGPLGLGWGPLAGPTQARTGSGHASGREKYAFVETKLEVWHSSVDPPEPADRPDRGETVSEPQLRPSLPRAGVLG